MADGPDGVVAAAVWTTPDSTGVHPDHQGKGLGHAIVEPGVAEADAAGVPAFLEPSEQVNVRFYERLGFTVTAEVPLPDGGPVTWAFRREPAVK